jgi:hypothetical protein
MAAKQVIHRVKAFPASRLWQFGDVDRQLACEHDEIRLAFNALVAMAVGAAFLLYVNQSVSFFSPLVYPGRTH